MGGAIKSVTNAVAAPVKTAVNVISNPGSVAKNPLGTIAGLAPGGALLGQAAGIKLNDGSQLQGSPASANGINYTQGTNGQPTAPQFNSLLGPDGMIKDVYQVKNANPVALGQSGLDQIKQQATRTGPSAWAGLQNQAIDQQTNQGLANNAQSAAGATANATSGLAMSGGLSDGARASLAQQQERNQMMGAQGVYNQANQNKLGVATQDESNRLAAASQLNGAENQAAQTQLAINGQSLGAQQFNVGNSLTDVTQQRQNAMNQYNQQMSAWGAGKTADATAASAPQQSGGLLGFLGI